MARDTIPAPPCPEDEQVAIEDESPDTIPAPPPAECDGYGLQFSDGSWFRNDGYATTPGRVNGAWTGTREAAQRLIDLCIPLDTVTIAPLPVACSGDCYTREINRATDCPTCVPPEAGPGPELGWDEYEPNTYGGE